ncbi:DNA gyrase subunit B, partial [Escherichia coli]|nr:DNA gyrase subunit B [Escherichia coli]
VVHADIRLWTLWNGMIAYLLMGTLMAGEWLVRQRVMKNDA